jgi:putative FmdB family regulatory protein
MPLYDYKCSVCGHGKEVMLRLAELDRAVVQCVHCNFPMNRQVSAPMVVSDYPPLQMPGNW